MRFSLGCELAYDVLAPTTLILHAKVMRNGQQAVTSESLAVTPVRGGRTHAGADGANLYRRLLLQPGPINVRYQAEVVLDPDA